MSDSKESVEKAVAGPMRQDHLFLRRTLKAALVLAFAAYFAAGGAFIALRYGVLPRIDDFRPRIETFVSAKLHAELRVAKLTPYWAGLEPGVDVTGLTIRDRDGNIALSVPHATATLSWRSLMHGKPTLASLVVDRPEVLVARATDGTLTVAGVQVPTTHTGSDTTFSNWVLSQQAIILRGGTLRWRDSMRQAPELALHDIRAAIINSGFEHRVALQAPPEGTVLKGPLDFRARFHHMPLTELGKPQNWSGEAYVSTGPVDLPILARYVKSPIKLNAGRIDNAIWANFSGGQLRSARGELQGADIGLQVRPTQPPLDVPLARFGWTAEIEPRRDYRIRLTNLRAELGQPPLSDGTPVSRTLALKTLSGRYRVATVEHGQLMSVAGDRVDLGVLAAFSRALPLPEHFLNQLVRFDPRGLIANYTIELERARSENALPASEQRVESAAPIVRYRFKGDLEGISVAAQEPPPGLSAAGHPRAGLPGFENLWGSVDANETQGAVTIDTVNAALTLPGEFDDPRLVFDRLRGRGQWTVSPAPGQPHKAFAVTVSELGVENADTAGSIVATYTNPGRGRGSLDLSAKIARAKAASVPRYLPTSVGEHLRHYLGHGLQAGTAHDATIEVRGDLDKFPYSREPKAGVFKVVAPFTGGRFDPSPYPMKTLKSGAPDVWPALDGIDGVFSLAQNVLRFDIDRAHYKRVMLDRVSGRIDDLGSHASSLIIDGKAHGPLVDFLDYVNESAAGSMTGHVAQKLRASGMASLDLTLTVPRTVEPHVSVAGTVGLRNSKLEREQWPPLEQLTGNVHFTEHTLSLERVAGRWLGGEVRANGALDANGAYAFDIAGRIAADSARELDIDGPAGKLLGRAYGTAPYAIDVRGRKGGIPQVSAHSDLSGLALDFPAPLGKALGTPMPFALSVQPASGDPAANLESVARADVQLGPLTANYLLRRDAAQPARIGAFSVIRGALGIGAPAELPAAGVSAKATLPSLDADAWRTVAGELRASSNKPGGAGAHPVPDGQHTARQFMPTRLAAHIDSLQLFGREWTGVDFDGKGTDNDWQASIRADQLAGTLSWQRGAANNEAGRINAHFTRATVPVKVGHDIVGEMTAAARAKMPAIDLLIDNLTVRERPLGRLAVNARNVDEDGVPVWQLDKLDLVNPAGHLTASANWRTARRLGANAGDAPRRTVIDFKLDIADAGALLDQLGLPRTVKGGAGTLSGKAGWLGDPTAVDYPTLRGELALDLHHGQILKVDPGVAKLLGVLSLQSLTRVLTLNFKDVIGEGLPFERVTGTGRITDGIGRTDNFRIVTAPARADLSGTVDLAAETQDLHVEVTPTLNAGSAVIAATIVNPLLGLGAFVANLALSQSIAHAFATRYAITGSWSQPRVERVSGDRGKMAVPVPTDATGK
ncbi:TIGR02099 family protein [Trinickia sp. LjRoot230]|uniref:YhdP family protein n=1 Tax=Trinickia sp. LjRoot230 TaxID=3342288 RepID=UPI003ECE1B21